tara:strand:- start:1701 stop:2690 length:990 start_codon:yes stop_codon:yes gene_type:complete
MKLSSILPHLIALSVSAVALCDAQDEPNIGTLRDVAVAGRIPDAGSGSGQGDASGVPSMAGDDEFGDQVIIERVSNWYPFSLRTSLTGYRTNNAELAASGGTTDSYMRGLAALNYTPLVKGNLFADLGVSEELYRYKNLSTLDFDYQRAHAGFYYYIPPTDKPASAIFENGFFFANYSFYRVSDNLFGPAVFKNNSVVLGFQKALSVKKGHQIFYGASTDLSFDASSQIFQRNEYRLYGGYSVNWTEDLLSQASYVASWFDYSLGTQNDWNHVAELISTWIAARPMVFGSEGEIYLEASANFTLNDSNVGTQDYEYFTWGGGVGFRTTF